MSNQLQNEHEIFKNAEQAIHEADSLVDTTKQHTVFSRALHFVYGGIILLILLFVFIYFNVPLLLQNYIVSPKLENIPIKNTVKIPEAVNPRAKYQAWEQEKRVQILSLSQYQVKLAEVKVLYEHNTQQAMSLLLNVKGQLRQVDDPAIEFLNKKITDAVSLLQSEPNFWDILNKIDAMKLHLQQFVVNAKSHSVPHVWEKKRNISLWGEVWFDIKQSLSDLIQVSRVSTDINKQQVYDKWNLLVQLQQLKLAALYRDNTVFQQQLKVIQHEVQQCCNIYEKQQQQVLKMITFLQSINIRPVRPNLSAISEGLEELAAQVKDKREINI